METDTARQSSIEAGAPRELEETPSAPQATAAIEAPHHGDDLVDLELDPVAPLPELYEDPSFEPPQDLAGWLLFQRCAAACGLLFLCVTLLPWVWLAVRLTSRGPAFFKQKRRGLGGRPFTIWKIRTMRSGSERSTALGVGRGESSVTLVGRVLRRLKIDEFPQLWNVLRGEMELVGPRPLPMALEDELRTMIPEFRNRNRVRPGLTSFAQLVVVDNLVGDDLLEDWQQRYQAEIHYLTQKSVRYDLLVIVLTAVYQFRSLFSAVRRKFGSRPERLRGPGTVTRVAGAPIANLDYDRVVDQATDWVEAGASRYVAIAPVHSVVESWWNAEHRVSLECAGLVTADGMPVVVAQAMLGFSDASRVYGPTLMLRLMERALERKFRVALFGGHPERLEKLREILELSYPGLEIVFCESPPFRALSAEEDGQLCERLQEAKPDFLFVGLGCPKQERWMAEHVGRVPGVMFGVGAAFDFHAGAVKQAPRWMQRCALEWLFRVCMEPRRLFWRYATTNPTYLCLLAGQVLKRVVLGRRYQRMVIDARVPAQALVEDEAIRDERIAVCLATWKRPHLLRATLEGLAAARMPAGCGSILVRVVDNDSEESARGVVEEMQARAVPGFEIEYEVETRRCISAARNRSVRGVDADWVAFLDDDEVPDPDWLVRLVDELRASGADAGFGSVRPVSAAPLPGWIRAGGFLDKLPYPPGCDVGSNHARTSNALVRGSWLNWEGFRFDQRFGRSGAEDSELFGRLHQAGARYRAVPSAVVREWVEPSQATFGWLARRFARNGRNFERLQRDTESALRPLLRFGKRAVEATWLGLAGLVALPFGRRATLARSGLYFVRAFAGLWEWAVPSGTQGYEGYESVRGEAREEESP